MRAKIAPPEPKRPPVTRPQDSTITPTQPPYQTKQSTSSFGPSPIQHLHLVDATALTHDPPAPDPPKPLSKLGLLCLLAQLPGISIPHFPNHTSRSFGSPPQSRHNTDPVKATDHHTSRCTWHSHPWPQHIQHLQSTVSADTS
jgi:hypothetical protein